MPSKYCLTVWLQYKPRILRPTCFEEKVYQTNLLHLSRIKIGFLLWQRQKEVTWKDAQGHVLLVKTKKKQLAMTVWISGKFRNCTPSPIENLPLTNSVIDWIVCKPNTGRSFLHGHSIHVSNRYLMLGQPQVCTCRNCHNLTMIGYIIFL